MVSRFALSQAIDSSNISRMLQAAGIDVSVQVNHVTGECVINSENTPLSADKEALLKNLMRGMPQYQGDLP